MRRGEGLPPSVTVFDGNEATLKVAWHTQNHLSEAKNVPNLGQGFHLNEVTNPLRAHMLFARNVPIYANADVEAGANMSLNISRASAALFLPLCAGDFSENYKTYTMVTSGNVREDAPKPTKEKGAIALPEDEAADWMSMGPVDFAKYLCDAPALEATQQRPISSVTRDMVNSCDQEVARRAKLTDAQLRTQGTGDTRDAALPQRDRRLRALMHRERG